MSTITPVLKPHLIKLPNAKQLMWQPIPRTQRALKWQSFMNLTSLEHIYWGDKCYTF